MGKPFKKTKIGKLLGGLGKVVLAGSVDFIPGAETLIRLVSKTPEDEENTNHSDFYRFAVVVVICISVIGLISGKLSPEQHEGIINSLGK